MWSEARSALHDAEWRGKIDAPVARQAHELLEQSPLQARSHERLGAETWKLADQLGWAKTFDAEYVALAQLLDCRLVTLDGRLRRGTERLGFVVTPSEL
jgi:predicted nucleic acid-binding protein